MDSGHRKARSSRSVCTTQRCGTRGLALDDCTAVKVGMTNASMYAYVADGENGLYVLQLTSSDMMRPRPIEGSWASARIPIRG